MNWTNRNQKKHLGIHNWTQTGKESDTWAFCQKNEGSVEIKQRLIKMDPTQGMDVCVCIYSVCVVLCVGSGLATDLSLIQGVLPSI
jgi:hypothetical protein